MPIDSELSQKQWMRYAWVRDNGHQRFVKKADLCERFFQGDQWDKGDKAILKAQRRPALTINKIISTISNVMGEQIYNRSEISFRPRGESSEKTSEILQKVFKYISDDNQLDWVRSDMFADGIITSRGFIDVRMDFDQSMQGDIRIENLNPKNVMIDPDADSYDPDKWNEVFVTRWLTADDIAVLYNKEDAELLRTRAPTSFMYGYDSIEGFRDRFGDRGTTPTGSGYGWHDETSVMRNIRVIERQHRKMDRQLHFVSPRTGEMRPVPTNWTKEHAAKVAEQFELEMVPKLVNRIRWTVTADNVVLHDDWSPYKHFTVVPYFPYLRRGATVGLVENLVDSQELLNKTFSQELHIANTTANSGYKVRSGALTNMSIEELEDRGAETGLVIEVNGDPDKDVVKISPNAVPTALDRISYKAEEAIKSISGVSDSQQGMDRADVAAKAIQQKRQAGSTNLAKPLDSLVRTDYILARNVLALVQEYMTEERLLTITKDQATGEQETIAINQISPEGEVLNDLMVGEYDVIISSVPQRETLEDSQFDQVVAMRKELGVQLPDAVIIRASRLMNKNEIIKAMEEQANSPEAQAQRELQNRAAEAEVGKTEAETLNKHADAGLRQAKTQKELAEAGNDTGAEELQLEREKAQLEMQIQREKADQEMQIEREKAALKAKQDAQMAAEKLVSERVNRMTQQTNGDNDHGTK